jgi:hypothetical protein
MFRKIVSAKPARFLKPGRFSFICYDRLIPKQFFLGTPLPITNYQLPITDYQLPITDYQLPITNYQLPITDYQ